MSAAALASIDPREAEGLVRRLATDDAFRQRLASSPARTLRELHIDLPSAALPEKVALPPTSQIVEALRAITSGDLAPARSSVPARPKYWPALRMSPQPAAR